MKMLFYTLLLASSCSTSALCQEFYPLTPGVITYVQDDESSKEQGMSFSLDQEAKLNAIGSDDTLTLRNLKMSNIGLAEARLTFDLSITDFGHHSYQRFPGNYYITFFFYDEDKRCLVASSLYSDAAWDLIEFNGNGYSNQPMSLQKADDVTYEFLGRADIVVHRAFFYRPGSYAGGIKPIKYVSVSIFHLGAG